MVNNKSTLLLGNIFNFMIVGVVVFIILAVESAQPNPVRPTSGCQIKSVTGPITEPDGLSRIRHAGDIPQLVDTDARTFSCVDARTEHSIVGSFGGDIGEFLTGLDTFRRLCTNDAKVSEERVLNMLTKFVDAHTTPLRPFYMHTDNRSMIGLLNAMGADSFPTTEPDLETKKKWFDTMFQSTTRYHGCGHLWYQIAHPDEYNADVDLTFGLMKAFFELFWNPEYSNRIHYELVLGEMDAKAVVVVDMESRPNTPNKPNKCIDRVVPVHPRYCPKGCPATNVRDFKKSLNYNLPPESDVFTLHQSAVERHRKKVITPFFLQRCQRTRPRMTFSRFYSELTKTAERWALASLTHLHALPDEKPHLRFVVKLESD